MKLKAHGTQDKRYELHYICSMEKPGIIFDCDGVLVDSEKLSARVLHAYLVELGLTLSAQEVDEFYRGWSLKDVELDVIERLKGQAPARFQQEIADRTRTAFDSSLQAVSGVTELLQQLQREGYPLAVASSGTPEKISHSLSLTQLSEFFGVHVYSATQVAHGKPAPDLFLFAAEKLGLPAEKCIVIEDSPAGVRGAVAAQSFTIGYCAETQPLELEELGAHVVQDMKEVYPLLCERTISAIQ